MRQVILIGDSIRAGYQPVVARLLRGLAQVWGPLDNCYTSTQVLARLNEWLLDRLTPRGDDGRPGSVVHLNVGLHDLKRYRPDGRIETPLDVYREQVLAILSRVVRHPTRPRVISARTTPVNQARHNRRKEFDRHESDVERYNEVADAVAGKLVLPLNDLYALVMQQGRDALLTQDGVHYTPDGYERLGESVAAAIRSDLACL